VRDRWSERFGDEHETTREREAAGFRDRGIEGQDYDEEPLDDEYADEGEELEERVLEAFRNDPVLSERAVDIGAIGRGIIELTGWVHTDDETQHAVTVTRGVPGVDTVVNRLVVRDEEDRMNDSGRRYESGEAETSPRWEGQGVGTGRPRQGTSADPGRHADPKPVLEDRWQGKDKAIRAAAEDLDGVAERRANVEDIPGDRTGGSPVAPSGVPKGDHVADPASAEPILREQTGRITRAD
jgi:BON domain-containing protein